MTNTGVLVTDIHDQVDLGRTVRGLRFWSRVGVAFDQVFIVEGWGGPSGLPSSDPLLVLTPDIFVALDSCKEVDPATAVLFVYARLKDNSEQKRIFDEVEEIYGAGKNMPALIKTKSGFSFGNRLGDTSPLANTINKIYPVR